MAFKTDFLTTEDDIRIAYDHFVNGFDRVIIIAHGFNLNKDVYAIKKLAEVFSREYDVITFDFRGHGKSGDFFTWTALEQRDLSAVVEYAKIEGYKKVAVLGLSLGAAIAIIEAGHNKDIDNVIAVSAPYDVWKINFKIMGAAGKKRHRTEYELQGPGEEHTSGKPLDRKNQADQRGSKRSRQGRYFSFKAATIG